MTEHILTRKAVAKIDAMYEFDETTGKVEHTDTDILEEQPGPVDYECSCGEEFVSFPPAEQHLLDEADNR